MSTVSRKHIQPTPRDLAIVRLLGERGVASQERLLATFWPESVSPRTGQDRLAQLVGAGVIRTERIAARGREEVIYSLARRGAMLLPATERVHLITRRPPYAEMAHLLKSGEILDRLEERYGLISWVPERILKSHKVKAGQAAQIADFSVELRHPLWGLTRWMVEVDGAYFGQRLQAKIASLGSGGEDVLWVTYSRRRLDRLRELAAPFACIRLVLFDSL